MEGEFIETVVSGSTAPGAIGAVDCHPSSDAENIDWQYERRPLGPAVNMYGLVNPPEMAGE